jgi:spore coat protein U domain-containing protein, fimbrial subunit CupE1/2/3/6
MNKRISLVSAVVAVAVIVFAMGGAASAGGTDTLTVNATVLGSCYFNTATSTLPFTLDPSSGANAVATVVPTFWCTRGTTVTTLSNNTGLNFAAGSNRMKSAANPTEFIPYSLGLSAASMLGAGKSTPINLTITGTVLNANFINALAANDYSDTVVITIAP